MDSLILSLNRPIPKPKYEVNRCTLIETCTDPQILECETSDGVILYIRWNGKELVCLEKRLGIFICAGEPFLHRDSISIPLDQIEFYLEMYSKHQIKFY